MYRLIWSVLLISVLLVGWCAAASAQQAAGGDFSTTFHPEAVIPKNVIILKGAWASASDNRLPDPETGGVSGGIFSSPYFGITYNLPKDWIQEYEGPPPSDSGRYVLAEIIPSDAYKGPSRGQILITAEDLFFTPLSARNALQFVNYTKDNLQADYKIELGPSETKIGGHPFNFFAYWSPVARLHWYVLTTQIRCHVVQIVISSQDTKLLDSMVRELSRMQLSQEAGPTSGMGGGDVPACMSNYATDQNVISRVNPVFTGHKFNPVPVRIIIDKTGRVKHIHFLSAFPDEVQAVTDAMKQWRLKPYLVNRQPMEVETGIMFGAASRPKLPSDGSGTIE
jgi:protein TonB